MNKYTWLCYTNAIVQIYTASDESQKELLSLCLYQWYMSEHYNNNWILHYSINHVNWVFPPHPHWFHINITVLNSVPQINPGFPHYLPRISLLETNVRLCHSTQCWYLKLDTNGWVLQYSVHKCQNSNQYWILKLVVVIGQIWKYITRSWWEFIHKELYLCMFCTLLFKSLVPLCWKVF